ncbi:MAG: DivIVA domain-containing protein [Clostridia bacterium]|nr:DivIVA domain-containing protein [Clostridia bacterium]
MQNTPVFRKSMNGYNKEDVNSYIINMSKRMAEAESDNKRALSRADAELQESVKTISNLYAENARLAQSNELLLNEANQKASKIEELSLQIIELQQLLARKEAEKAREEKKTYTEKELLDSFGGITDDNEKVKIFDCISSKTGEVVLSAYRVADEIIAKANKEAENIIRDANTRRDNMIKTISGSADSVTTNINSYIKTAVDGCLEKIYSSIKTVGADDVGK